MDKVADSPAGTPQGGKQPGAPGAASRSGASGEGSRSALEQLIQQERRRESQRPRDAVGPREPPARALSVQRACRRNRRTLSGSWPT